MMKCSFQSQDLGGCLANRTNLKHRLKGKQVIQEPTFKQVLEQCVDQDEYQHLEIFQ